VTTRCAVRSAISIIFLAVAFPFSYIFHAYAFHPYGRELGRKVDEEVME
jgi:hypothetical protein